MFMCCFFALTACGGGGADDEQIWNDGDVPVADASTSDPTEEREFALDPECELTGVDFVIRGLDPASSDDPGFAVILSEGNLRDIPILAFEVRACTTFELSHADFQFTAASAFPGDELVGDPRDPSGIIIGERRRRWVTRFYDFRLRVNGSLYGQIDDMEEGTLSDESGGPQWKYLQYHLRPGDSIAIELSASIRDEGFPYESFAVDYAVNGSGAPSPNPRDRESPTGLDIGYSQFVRLLH